MKKIFLVSYIVFFSNLALANDMGNFGKVYPIEEKNMIDLIKEKVEEKKINGEYEILKNELSNKGKRYSDRPVGSPLPRATVKREYAIDPTYTLNKDIVDDKGKLLYQKGYSFNPLTIKSMTKTLCFFNGDDKEQVIWANDNCRGEKQYKKIMASGSIKYVTSIIDERIYFDQYGYLIKHFRIEKLPATVKQSGYLLHVEEINI